MQMEVVESLEMTDIDRQLPTVLQVLPVARVGVFCCRIIVEAFRRQHAIDPRWRIPVNVPAAPALRPPVPCATATAAAASRPRASASRALPAVARTAIP